ncbi:MAG: hypothetical protein HYZ48_03475 [Chlamydiales bacterium]|nr:hypothetical protein [Chlamydiales bacterium]
MFLQENFSIQDWEAFEIEESVRKDPLLKYRPLTEDQILEQIEEKKEARIEKKTKLLARVLDAACVEKIRGAVDAEEMIRIVLDKSSFNKWFYGIGIATSILGITSMVMGTVCTGGTALLAAEVLGLITSFMMFAMDFYLFVESFQNDKPGQHDKLCLLISSLLGFAAITAGAFISKEEVASLVGLAFGSFWLLINLICYFRIRQLESGSSV